MELLPIVPSNRAWLPAALTALLVMAGTASGAITGAGTVAADVGQLIEIVVTDGSIATYAEFTPTSGTDAVKFSTSDFLRFSNAKSNVQEAFTYAASVSFAQDSDGSTATTSVSYQGTTTTLTDLVYLSQSAAGDFLPWRIVTGSDLTSESTGWTQHADCGTSNYKGSFSIAYFNNAGAAQSALTRYYSVCDTQTEIYVGTTKDLSSGDKALIYTQTSSGAGATAGNYEVAIGGQDYVFYSAASAATVTLRQGNHAALTASSTTQDLYVLMKFPDGFPAGTLTTTVTATASDIVT